MTRVGKRLALITENLMFEGLGISSVGLRIMLWRKAALNFLVLINNIHGSATADEFIPVIIDFSIKL